MNTAAWNRTAGKAVVREPQQDARTHPAYHPSRGMTALPASGGRKRAVRPAC